MIGDASFQRPIHRPKAGRPVSASDMDKTQRAIFGVRGIGGIRAYVDFDGLVIDGSNVAGLSRAVWRIVATDQNQHTVTISGGWCIHGVTVTLVNSTDVTVMSGTISDPAYAVLEYTYATRAARIVPTATIGYPAPDATTFRCALHRFYVSGERIKHLGTHQTGDILIPGWA